MKKTLVTGTFALIASAHVVAAAPGGPNCGWGNMLFEGQSGMPAHLSATIVDGTSGNATFGMTSGTNGCSTDGTLTYGGKPLFGFGNMLDEFSQDVALGQGEALSAVAITMGIPAEQRPEFYSLLNRNFDQIFTSPDVSAEQVHNNMIEVLKRDSSFAGFVS